MDDWWIYFIIFHRTWDQWQASCDVVRHLVVEDSAIYAHIRQLRTPFPMAAFDD